jgi:3-oxoacyl-[acyl-carrier protein] reductase
VDKTVQEFGRIDILVNNAGVFMGGPIEEVAVEQADKTFPRPG